MRTLRSVVLALVVGIVVLGLFALVTPTSALADPPVHDPNCNHPCPATKRLHGYPCTFAGCSVDGLCAYAC